MEKYFKAIANNRRIELLSLLRRGELKLEVIVHKTKMPYKTIFRNLSILRTAGFVESRIFNNAVYFKLKPYPEPIVKQLIGLVIKGY